MENFLSLVPSVDDVIACPRDIPLLTALTYRISHFKIDFHAKIINLSLK